MPDPVVVERQGAVASVLLNRPEVLNAIDETGAEALHQAFVAIDRDPDVRAVILGGHGRAFMAGGDVRRFAADPARAGEVADRVITAAHAAIRLIVGLHCPVVARLQGAVAGAGVSFALACDFALAAEDARFTLAFTRIGAPPDTSSTFFLPRLIGRRRAIEMAMLADPVTAAEAVALGLVNRVVPTDRLDAEVHALAERLANGPTRAFAAVKRLMRDSHGRDLDAQLDAERTAFLDATATEDFREGVAAFVEKRAAAFRGV